MKKQRQWPWVLAAFAVFAIDSFLVWNLRLPVVELARQSLFYFLVWWLMIACALIAFTIGVMITIQKIVVV